jgi:hypothetical protein
MVQDLEMTDDEINAVVMQAAMMIRAECQGDRAAELSAAMGTLMYISRDLGSRDASIVRVLSEMFADNPRQVDA